MSSEVSVRPASVDDLDELTSLFESYRAFYKQDADHQRAKEYLTHRLKRRDSLIYVAEMKSKANKLVGFVQLYPLLDSLKLGNKWLLNDLYVDPEARGTGLSKKLLAQGKDVAHQTNSTGILLTTQKTNKIGNSLYPSQGWKLDEEFNHYKWTREEWEGTYETGLVYGPESAKK